MWKGNGYFNVFFTKEAVTESGVEICDVYRYDGISGEIQVGAMITTMDDEGNVVLKGDSFISYEDMMEPLTQAVEMEVVEPETEESEIVEPETEEIEVVEPETEEPEVVEPETEEPEVVEPEAEESEAEESEIEEPETEEPEVVEPETEESETIELETAETV